MKTFRYALLINISLTYCTSYSFAQETTVSYATTLENKASKGDVRAQIDLGYLYKNGNGVPEDQQKADEWLKKVIDQKTKLEQKANRGNAKAQLNLGYLYQYGIGVTQNSQTAKEWFQKAADRKNIDA